MTSDKADTHGTSAPETSSRQGTKSTLQGELKNKEDSFILKVEYLLSFHCSCCSESLKSSYTWDNRGMVIFWTGWHPVYAWSQNKQKALWMMIHFKSRKEKEKSNLGISPTNLFYTWGVFNLFRVNKFPAFSKVWYLLYYFSVNRRIWMYLLYVIFLLVGGQFRYKCLPSYRS